jgi:hypothetical protein
MGGNTAEGKDAEAGYNPENQAELAGSANDGDENTAWVTWENRPAEEEWWYVDLGAKYNLAGIEVLWGVDYSKEYILQAREEAPAEDATNTEVRVCSKCGSEITDPTMKFCLTCGTKLED